MSSLSPVPHGEPCPCGKPGCYLPEPVFAGADAAIERWVEAQGLTMADVKRDNRRPAMVRVRREIARYLRDHGWSLPRIGVFLDRDHTTVMNLLNPRPHRTPE